MTAVCVGNRLGKYYDEQILGFSNEAIISVENEKQYCLHYTEPMSISSDFIEFYNLVLDWKNETEFESSINTICMNSSYQRIIGMGEKALPFIFSEMQREPDHWFWALKSITGTELVLPKDRGSIEVMTFIWLSWAKENNYI